MDLKPFVFGTMLTVSMPVHSHGHTDRSSTFITTKDMASDVALVIQRQPKYVTQYQQVCSQVPVERRAIGSAVMGGVLGAAIGNQIGDGRGRDIATAAGAVIGSQLGSANESVIEMQARCSQQPVTVPQGEIVTFEYRGRRFTQVFP